MPLFHFKHEWFFVMFLFCGALVLANLFHFVLFRLLKRDAAVGKTLGWGLQKHIGRPARAIFVLTCAMISLPFVPHLSAALESEGRHIGVMLIVASIGWFAVGCVYVAQELMLRKYDLTATNNLSARRVHTQFQVFRRILIAFVVVLTGGALLWTFNDPRIWHYGSGLLASAGVATLIVAAAAKSTASNFLAGLQIALTEPIRIDDVVVVQGEWGKIEEITSSYVVLKIWDLRRLIIPLSWFIENPFANWTRENSNILTTAFLYLDYTVPVKEVRRQLEVVVKASGMWDGVAMGCQVTNLTDKSNLQALVREEMIDWVRENYPTAFPTVRSRSRAEVEIEKGASSLSSSAPQDPRA